MIAGRVLHGGEATGSIVVLDEPLSFWGGLDPATGTIIDQAHPQVGVSVAGRVVAMPASRGSSGTPGVLGEALRRGTGPLALVIAKPDVNLVAGALVAATLYDASCPVVLVSSDDLAHLRTGDSVTVAVDGRISPEGSSAS